MLFIIGSLLKKNYLNHVIDFFNICLNSGLWWGRILGFDEFFMNYLMDKRKSKYPTEQKRSRPGILLLLKYMNK